MVKLTEEKRAELYEQRKQHALQYMKNKEMKNKMTKERIEELHNILVQTCIDYIRNNNIGDLEDVSFQAECLQYSAEYGSWTPATDSSLSCDEYIMDESNRYIGVRKQIGYSM